MKKDVCMYYMIRVNNLFCIIIIGVDSFFGKYFFIFFDINLVFIVLSFFLMEYCVFNCKLGNLYIKSVY